MWESLSGCKTPKHQRKAFGTMSRCTALTTQHVNKHIHTFLSDTNPAVFTYSGPVKSNPTYVNAGSSLTLNWGNGGGHGAGWGGPSYRQQITYLNNTRRTHCLP